MSEPPTAVAADRDAGPPAADLAALAAAAVRFRGVDPADRARLARETARAVAAAAAEWAETAAGIKWPEPPGGGGSRAAPAVLAEEIATGPLPTLRLLLLTAAALDDVAARGLPRVCGGPRVEHAGAGVGSRIAVDVLPLGGLLDPLLDGVIWRGHRATVRCIDQGGVEAFLRAWRREAEERPRSGGLAAVLGAGNVTGLAAADCISQVFEHGRAAVVKLHPLHAPLVGVLGRALAPLAAAGLVRIFAGDAAAARGIVADGSVTHVHLTGGRGAFDALVRGDRGPGVHGGAAALAKPITCELGNVTPWIVVPGRYTPRQLAFQADLVAASIAHNTSFNCIATKLVVTCRSWPQRGEFLAAIGRRLASLPARPGWYPGARAAWETVVGRPAPADGTLPCVFRTDVDLAAHPECADREWFVPVAAETAVDAGDIEAYCVAAGGLARGLPGSLAASVTEPPDLSRRDRERVENLVGHLPFGVVAVNGWSAVGYLLGNVPWGGFPGATVAEPKSGIGHVHDPLLLPLVQHTVVRCPLVESAVPPWVPWHPGGGRLSRGLVDLYGTIARGRSGLGPLVRMLPATLLSALRPPRDP
jgi:aldehyde dehydrogenase (NAD(P)+)